MLFESLSRLNSEGLTKIFGGLESFWQLKPKSAKGGKMQEKPEHKNNAPDQENGAPEQVVKLQETLEKVKSLEEEIDKLKSSLSAQLMDNARIIQIANREKENMAQKTRKEVANLLIPVADDLERAMSMLGETGQDANCRGPVEFILKSLSNALSQMGLKVVDPIGEKFDPHKFELGGQEEGKGEEDTVCRVLRKGYSIGEEIIRPALVVCITKSNHQKEENQ